MTFQFRIPKNEFKETKSQQTVCLTTINRCSNSAGKGYKQSSSSWQYDMLLAVFLYFPAGTSTQLPPTMLQSIMKRSAKRILLSYVRKLFEPRPSTFIPFSRMPARVLETWSERVQDKKVAEIIVEEMTAKSH